MDENNDDEGGPSLNRNTYKPVNARLNNNVGFSTSSLRTKGSTRKIAKSYSSIDRVSTNRNERKEPSKKS